MRTRILLAIAFVVFGISDSLADDGLVIQFTIAEEAHETGARSSYTNAVLMKLNEEVSFELDEMYVLKVRSRPTGSDSVDLLVSLKDLIDGKPYYVGAQPVALRVGDSATLSFSKYGTDYSIELDTSYGKLP